MIIGNFPASGGGVVKSIQVIEYTNAISDQNVSINAVDINNCIIFVNSLQQTYPSSYPDYAYLVDSTNLLLYHNIAGVIKVTIIEFYPGIIKSIQRFKCKYSTSTVSINSVNTSKSAIITTSLVQCNSNNYGVSAYANFTNNTSISIETSGVYGPEGNFTFEVIEFN